MPNDSIFEEDELQAEALAPDAEAPPVEKERERGPDGKFVAKDAGEDGDNPTAEAEDEAQRGDGKVPQGALHAEREKHKGTKAERDAIAAELAQAKAQLEAIAALRQQIADRKPAELPAADDPAALEHLRARLEEQGQQLNRFSQQQDMAAAETAEVQQLGAVMQQGEAQFREATPDYDAAINHVVQARAQELMLYGLSPAQVQQTIAEEATEIVRSAVQQGRNPAELAYAIAQSRGYRPAQGGQEQPQGGAAETLAAIAKAQGAAKSLGSGGGSGAAQLNAEAIAAMNADEFDALYSTPEGKKLIDSLA